MGYVKQANIAQGPQQANNAATPAYAAPPLPENKKSQNELLEVKHGERLDVRQTSTTSDAHSAMATVGAINRSKNTGG